MIPSLVTPMTNYFLVKHILVNGTTLDKSNMLSGVTNIIDFLYVYGDYCICSTKQSDGSYSIWQSSDIGKTWVSVLNVASEIISIARYDSGHVFVFLANAELYESTNSGGSFAKISTTAPIARTVAVTSLIDNRIRHVIVHDGEKIWHSDDVCRSWYISVDVRALNTPQSLIYPAIAVSGMQILAGAGQHILYSNDLGDSWAIVHSLVSREYVYRINSIGNDNGVSFIMITDYRGDVDSFKLYNSVDLGVTWTQKFNSVIPLSNANGYSNHATGSSAMVKMYTIGTTIIQQDLDFILHDNWKNAPHDASGYSYDMWVIAEPVISDSTQLVYTTIITTDGIIWKYYNEYYNNFNYIDTISDLLEDADTNVEPYL